MLSGILCGCGCGKETTIVRWNNTRDGAVKGQPNRHLRGHGRRPTRRARTVSIEGYPVVKVPGHPRAQKGSSYVFEHVLIAERALGRPLSAQHPVHHVDQDKTNNQNSNLVLCEDNAYHQMLHRRMRAYAACGDANAHRCWLCAGYDNQADITVIKSARPHVSAYHRTCQRNRSMAKRPRGPITRRIDP